MIFLVTPELCLIARFAKKIQGKYINTECLVLMNDTPLQI